MFVAVARIPPGPAALRQAAAVTGLAAADVSRLLAGTLPRILVRAAREGGRIAAELGAGKAVLHPCPRSGMGLMVPDVVRGHVRLAPGFSLRVDKIDQQQALEIGARTLHGRDDLSDHYGEFHGLLLFYNFAFAACATPPSRPTGCEAPRN